MCEEIRVIEYHMMNKERYFPSTFASSLCIRGFTYPTLLIKTRLQIQTGHSIYSGTLDAFSKIVRSEGFQGLYRGFWISTLQLLPSVVYFSSYEWTRHFLTNQWGVDNHRVKLAVGGFMATTISQTTLVPIEIVMQHLMLMDNASKVKGVATTGHASSGTLERYHMAPKDRGRLMGRLRAVLRGMYADVGFRGFYQGFWAAVFCHGPYNALFWLCYDHCADLLSSHLPTETPRLVIVSLAAPLGGMTAAFITNPLDVVRARIQVDGTKLKQTLSILWQEEGIGLLTKGASARVIYLGSFSLFTLLGYESVKRWSVLEEYRDNIRW